MHHSTSQPHVAAQCIPHHYTAIVHITPPQVFSILHNHTTFYTTPHCTTTSRHTTFHRRTSTLCTTLTIPDHTSTFHSTPHLTSQNYTSHTLHVIPHHHILQITASFYISWHNSAPPRYIQHHTSQMLHITPHSTLHTTTSHHHILHITVAFYTTQMHSTFEVVIYSELFVPSFGRNSSN